MFELHLLLVFMILGALVAVRAKDLLSSVIALGAVGMGLTVAFLVLKAPDLAIVQLVVEILCLVILLRATVHRESNGGRDRTSRAIFIGTLAFITLFLLLAFVALKELPAFGQPLMRVSAEYLARGLKDTGAANMVSAIILDFRAYDTLGEATILFTAVVGVLAVVRRVGRKK